MYFAYLGKVSGPLIDRFDLIIEVPSLSHAELLSTQSSHSNAEQTAHKERLQWARRRRLIADCRAMQSQRQGALNSDIKASALEDACQLTDTKKSLQKQTGAHAMRMIAECDESLLELRMHVTSRQRLEVKLTVHQNRMTKADSKIRVAEKPPRRPRRSCVVW